MTHDEAVNILRNYQLWRRGLPPYDFGQPVNMPFTPEKLGEAIDYAIAVMERDRRSENYGGTQFDELVDEFRRSPHSAVFDAKDDALDIIDDLQRYIRKLEATS